MYAQTQEMSLFGRDGRRKYVSQSEGRQFLSCSLDLPPRTAGLCATLYWTGCRLSEALELTGERVDREDGRLWLRSLKRHCGRQDGAPPPLVIRTVPVPLVFIEELDAIAPSDGSRIWPWSRQFAWRQVKLVMAHAGISGPHATPKGLRHHFGMMAAAANVPPNLIQRWMGHSKLETTMIYLDAIGPEERAFAERMWGQSGGCLTCSRTYRHAS